MNDIITIALKAFPVIALITTGVVLEKTAFISAEAVKGMKKLIMNLALPCLLFPPFSASLPASTGGHPCGRTGAHFWN